MEIKTGDYQVVFTENEKKIVFEGIMRLQNLKAYHPIKDLMKAAFNLLSEGDVLTLDFSKLEFLNSSGITNFSMFVLESKKTGKAVSLYVIGSNKVGWQDKSLNNFKKLWKDVKVEIID